MNLISSWKTFWQVLEEDKQFRELGLPHRWYFWFHYRGRFEARFRVPYKVPLIKAQILSQSVSFPLSFPYAGTAKGILLDREYFLLDVLLTEPKRIIDLGANIGLATLFLHCQFPQAEFVCVEPDPRNKPLLEKTIVLNQIAAHVIDCAVASKTGTLQLRYGRSPTCSALETSPMHQLERTVPVEVKTIPNILEQIGWDYIDLLKIDIEGSEEDLLLRNNQWLERVGTIIIEIHPSTTPEIILSSLQPYGFNLKRHRQGREPVYIATRA